MNNILRQKRLLIGLIVALIFICPVLACADVTTYTYDDINQTVTESAHGGNPFITASAGAGGKISPSGIVGVEFGSSMSFTITPNTGCSTQEVRVDNVIQTPIPPSYTFYNVMGTPTITAKFNCNQSIPLTVNVSNMSGGNVSSSPEGINCGVGGNYCSANYSQYADVLLTATPTACATFGGWAGDAATACSGATPCKVRMSKSKTIQANFNVETFTISASAGPGGSISPAGDTAAAKCSNLTYTITPAYGYHIKDVLVDTVSVGARTSYTFGNIQQAHTISAQFEADTILNLSFNLAGGRVTSSLGALDCTGNCSVAFPVNTQVRLTATAFDAYNFTGWSGACSGTGLCNLTTGASLSSMSVTANFVPKTLTITASAGSGGTITPSGVITVNYGANQTFTISPNTGNSITAVMVDGPSSVGTPPTYPFVNVTADHTISATFGTSGTCQIPGQAGAPARYFNSLQAAYNAAVNGETIECTTTPLTEGLTVNRNVTVTVDGGYAADFTRTSGSTTALKGMVQTQTGGGILTLKNFILNK